MTDPDDQPAIDRLAVAALFGLSGKVAVVTGGSRGIGFMIASGLVANGVKVYITARKAEACDAAAAELSQVGECISIPADLATEEGLASFVATLTEREPQIDILVNNAGAAWGAPLGEFPDVGFDKVMAINVKAPFMLTQALLPQLKAGATAQDPARVIMIGSIDGIRVPIGDNYSYSASKAGIHMMARHMASHLVKEHITINSIAPGPFESKMMAYLLDDPNSRKMVEGGVPRNRVGSPEDIAGTVIFLASRAGAYTTGAVIPVDGGISTL
ncbi:MAG TPA: SDR family oxidoreductase [Ilumatobacteraceae bacterium]|nr:SDR family oxidoreductase [Ilumatobacteraceae bacterium]